MIDSVDGDAGATRCQIAAARRGSSATGVVRIGPACPLSPSAAGSVKRAQTARPGQAQIVEPRHVVGVETRRQQLRFPRGDRRLEALQLADHRVERVRPFAALVRDEVLPAEEEPHEVLRADGLDLLAQALDRIAMDAREQRAVAPFLRRPDGVNAPAHRDALRGERRQRGVDSAPGTPSEAAIASLVTGPNPSSRERTISASAASRVHARRANSSGAAIGGVELDAFEQTPATAAAARRRPRCRDRSPAARRCQRCGIDTRVARPAASELVEVAPATRRCARPPPA